MEGVWSAEDTDPAAIEEALRKLLQERQVEEGTYGAARVLNLVAVVDAQWRGEIENRLEGVGRYHPSRTIVCSVERGRETLDAWATMSCTVGAGPGALALCHERVTIEIGPRHLPHLNTVVDPVLVHDLATAVWSPHGHPEAVDSLLGLADVVLLDSVIEPDVVAALARVGDLASQAYVVDLAWLRTTPWRERISATFDPPAWRRALEQISAITIRHRPDSAVAALLLVGWLTSRLDWKPRSLVAHDGTLAGRFRGRRQHVEVRLEVEPELSVPGLAGVTIETAGGVSLSLNRGPGGLAAVRRTPDGRTSSWTVLGASRGEPGIMGEGVRQALLRDPTYRPALDAARAMLS